MWGSTPPKAMVALMRVSSSSSPRMASWRWRGVMRLTLRSLAAFCGTRRQHPAEAGVKAAATHPCELQNFSSQVLEHRGDIDGRLGAYAHLVLCVLLEEALDTTARELEGRISMCIAR